MKRLILNPNGTERVVHLPIERYNQIIWSGAEVLHDKRRVIEGRQPSADDADALLQKNAFGKVRGMIYQKYVLPASPYAQHLTTFGFVVFCFLGHLCCSM